MFYIARLRIAVPHMHIRSVTRTAPSTGIILPQILKPMAAYEHSSPEAREAARMSLQVYHELCRAREKYFAELKSRKAKQKTKSPPPNPAGSASQTPSRRPRANPPRE